MEFVSVGKWPNSEYFSAYNEAKQVVAEIIRSDGKGVPSEFWGYRNLIPGLGGKSQSRHQRRFGPFPTFEEAKAAIETDFETEPTDG